MAGDSDWEDVPAAAPPPDQTAPAQTQTTPEPAPAPGAEGRQITVRPRIPPKPPPAPITPHEAAPVSVQPKEVAPAAPGQKPPPPSKEDWEDVPAQWPGYTADIGKGLWGGVAEGTEGLLGQVRDAPNLADYGLAWAGAHVRQALYGEDANTLLQASHGSVLRQAIGDNAYNALGAMNPFPSAATLQAGARRLGIDPGYTPQSTIGRYVHEIGAFAPGAVIPFGEAGLATRLAQTIAPAIGSETLGNMAKGTQFEPWARLVGAGLGGVTQSGIASYTAPMRASGQADQAAQWLREATTDPDAALAKARAAQAQTPPGMATGENIPGSRPTLAQVTGDMGQVAAERQYQSGEGQAVHAQRMAEQSAAQAAAAKGVQPTGASQNVADLVKQRLQKIDADHEAELGVRQAAHAQTTQRLTQEAKGMTSQVARAGEPEALGARAREALASSMAKAKEKEEALWKAIDPDKKVNLVTTKIGARARNIAKNIGYQKPMEGEERAIFDAAASLPRSARLADVMDLSSRLKAAMRQERFTNGNSPALKRMATLNTTMENIIANSASRASDAEAAGWRGRMQAARAATKARGAIERGPAGPVIQKGATSESYRTISSQVPGKVFAAGPSGYQKAQAFAEATGKPWLDPFKDIVSDSLAREATTDGMIDPVKLTRWQSKYRDALRALPDEVRRNYVSGPGEAGQALAEGAAQRRQALIEHSKFDVAKEMGKSPAEALRRDPAFKGLEGAESPKDVQRIVGGILQRPDAVTTMRRLANAVSGNPNAAEGLKRAAVDHILKRVTSTAEAGTSGVKKLLPGTFQKVIADNREGLRAAGLNDAQLGTLDKVAADLERQQRFNATKTMAGSDTAQNQYKSLKKLTKATEGAHHNVGWLAAGLVGGKEVLDMLPHSLHTMTGMTLVGAPLAAAYAGKKFFLDAARNKGIAKTHDLYHEAIMNPDVGADLLSRPSPGSHARLAEKFARQAMYAGLAGQRTAILRH